jgi:hypothetical protein
VFWPVLIEQFRGLVALHGAIPHADLDPIPATVACDKAAADLFHPLRQNPRRQTLAWVATRTNPRLYHVVCVSLVSVQAQVDRTDLRVPGASLIEVGAAYKPNVFVPVYPATATATGDELQVPLAGPPPHVHDAIDCRLQRHPEPRPPYSRKCLPASRHAFGLVVGVILAGPIEEGWLQFKQALLHG